MKKIGLLLALALTLCLAGCGGRTAGPDAPKDTKKIRVVTTIFPIYDWARALIGNNTDRVELALLLGNGVDLHSYQPTAQDIMKIAACDLFVYVGGESDAWVEDALKEATNKNMIALKLMDVLGHRAKREEPVEGMETEHTHHHSHDKEDRAEEHHDAHGKEVHGEGRHGHAHHEEAEYDEHIWLSLKNAPILCDAIAEALGRADADRAKSYAGNLAAYKEKLAALDGEYQKALSAAPFKTLLFGDRFPFRYLADDYGLRCYAAFAGCSAETEASFETIAFLSGKLGELRLPAVLTIEGRRHKIAETVAQNAQGPERKILTLDSMQATTARDAENGATYLSVMEKNLGVLKEATGGVR